MALSRRQRHVRNALLLALVVWLGLRWFFGLRFQYLFSFIFTRKLDAAYDTRSALQNVCQQLKVYEIPCEKIMNQWELDFSSTLIAYHSLQALSIPELEDLLHERGSDRSANDIIDMAKAYIMHTLTKEWIENMPRVREIFQAQTDLLVNPDRNKLDDAIRVGKTDEAYSALKEAVITTLTSELNWISQQTIEVTRIRLTHNKSPTFMLVMMYSPTWTFLKLGIFAAVFVSIYHKHKRLLHASKPTNPSQLIKACFPFHWPQIHCFMRCYYTLFPLNQSWRARLRLWRPIHFVVVLFWYIVYVGIYKTSNFKTLVDYFSLMESSDVFFAQMRFAFGGREDLTGINLEYEHRPILAIALCSGFFPMIASIFVTSAVLEYREVYLTLLLLFANIPLVLLLNLELRPSYLALPLPLPVQGQGFCDCCKDNLLASLRSYHGSRISRTGPHHRTHKSLLASAESGCRICTTVWQMRTKLPKDFRGYLNFWKPITSFEVDYDTIHVISHENQRQNYHSFQLLPSAGTSEDLDVASRHNLKARNSALEKLSPVELNSMLGTASRRLSDHTGSHQTLETASKWLNTCIECHPECKMEGGTGFSPTRLLFVGGIEDEITLCLRNDRPKSSNYMTLSHCWGNTKVLKLFQHNLESFRRRIPLAELPQTFQDAVKICRHLKYQYLWIDSLCIIQDSHEDWDVESAMMEQVYKYSVCNIAASAARNGTEGCLYPRNKRTVETEAILTRNSSSFAFGVDCLVNETVVYAENPLYERAWVLQELILPPRTIDCGKGQLFWRCRKLVATEVFSEGVPDSVMCGEHPMSGLNAPFVETIEGRCLAREYLGIVLPAATKTDVYMTAGRDEKSLFLIWGYLVGCYTSMKLTKSTDRPVALLGIVKMLEPILDTYVAGMWQCFLPFELLWVVPKTGVRDQELEYPSWSWLSIKGVVQYTFGSFMEYCDTLVTNLDHVELAGGSSHNAGGGRVDKTLLHLRGPVLRATWGGDWSDGTKLTLDLESLEENRNCIRFFGVTIYNMGHGEIWLDERGGTQPEDDIFCLPIIRRKVAEEGIDFLGLVLKEKRGVFQRIGIFRSHYGDISEIVKNVPVKSIVLA